MSFLAFPASMRCTNASFDSSTTRIKKQLQQLILRIRSPFPSGIKWPLNEPCAPQARFIPFGTTRRGGVAVPLPAVAVAVGGGGGLDVTGMVGQEVFAGFAINTLFKEKLFASTSDFYIDLSLLPLLTLAMMGEGKVSVCFLASIFKRPANFDIEK